MAREHTRAVRAAALNPVLLIHEGQISQDKDL